MKYIFLILIAPSIALAEDCSCLQKKNLTPQCIEFGYTSKALECLKKETINSRLKKLEAAQAKLDLRVLKIEHKGPPLYIDPSLKN